MVQSMFVRGGADKCPRHTLPRSLWNDLYAWAVITWSEALYGGTETSDRPGVEVHQRWERPYNAPLVESNEESSDDIISAAGVSRNIICCEIVESASLANRRTNLGKWLRSIVIRKRTMGDRDKEGNLRPRKSRLGSITGKIMLILYRMFDNRLVVMCVYSKHSDVYCEVDRF